MNRDVHLRDHVCLVYREPRELVDHVERYTRASMAARHVTVFVHSFATEAEALAFLGQGSLDFRRLLNGDFFLVSHYADAFGGTAGNGVDVEHVTRVIEDILARARGLGSEGARILVDASREYLSNGFDDEWFEFEEWLGKRLHQAVALACAYRAADVASPHRTARMLDAHLYRLGSVT